MNIPLRKLKAILAYLANNTNTKFLGKVKLMKLFYFVDFLHVKTFGSPITYDTYVNLEHGPVPSFIKNLVDDAVDDIQHSEFADTIDVERPAGTNMYRILPVRKFSKQDHDLLSPNELEILEKVCARYGNASTKEIEEASHRESAWKNTDFLERIPYKLAANDQDSKFSEEDISLFMEIA